MEMETPTRENISGFLFGIAMGVTIGYFIKNSAPSAGHGARGLGVNLAPDVDFSDTPEPRATWEGMPPAPERAPAGLR